MQPRTLYLHSFDRFDEILEYRLADGSCTILTRGRWAVLGVALTFGAFSREGERVAGIFASPDGPVFFLDARQVLGCFGQSAATVTAGPRPSLQRFAFVHGPVTLELVYQRRLGIGANPYDNDEEDVDLFAMIAAGVRREAFFGNYTRDWVECA